MTIFLAICIAAQEPEPRPPEVRPLAEEIRRAPTTKRRGYKLDSPSLIDGQVFCTLFEAAIGNPPADPRWPGLVRIDLATGATGAVDHFSVANLSDKQGVSHNVIDHFRLDDSGIGVVVIKRSTEDTVDRPQGEEKSIWRWDLNTGRVTSLGEWNVSRMIARLLGDRRLSVKAFAMDDVSELVGVRDPASGNSAALVVRNPATRSHYGIFIGFGGEQVILPTPDGRRVVVVEPFPTEIPPTVYSIDTEAPGGRGWLLQSQKDWQALGHPPYSHIAVVESGIWTGPAVIVQSSSNDDVAGFDTFEYVEFDAADGSIARRVTLSDDPESFVISPTGKLAAYTAGAENRLRIVDLTNGEVLHDIELEQIAFVYPFAFESERSLLCSGNNSIWRLELDGEVKATRVFVLDPDDDGD